MNSTTTTCFGADELDALQELGDEIATLAAHVHAATHRLLTLIVDFDRRRGWEYEGHRSCAHWLAFRTGVDLGAAREKVRAVRALERLPQVSAAMARGELSFAKVRSLTRVAGPESESELLEFARTSTAAQLERLVRGYRRGSRMDETEQERRRHQTRMLSVFPDDDGMYVIRGRVDPEVGALLMRAIEAASDALFRHDTAQEIEPAQRRADAIGLLAERALAAGFGRCASEAPALTALVGADSSGDRDTCDATRPDSFAVDVPDTGGVGVDEADCDRDAACVSGENNGGGRRTPRCSEYNADNCRTPVSGTRAERYQVMLHVDLETLQSGREGGRSELEDGTRVSAETSRRLSCDASVVRVTTGPDGTVLDVGRRTRTIPPALRRALEVRDRGCCFPGCGLRFTDGHHILHWADRGGTSLSNICLLCEFHHRLVHEGGYRVHMPDHERPIFLDPRGLPVIEAPPPIRLEDAAAARLVQQNRARGIDPDFRTSAARYRREEDIPWPVVVRAVDALDGTTIE